MKLHILGACGTFMAGIAYIAKQLGHEVLGIDQNIYPPMSDFLRNQDIELLSGYENYPNVSPPDLVIVGNALSRGNIALEHVLNQSWDYISGPQWLYEHVLRYKRVIAVSGTHGKTTTSSLLTWILESAGLNPGFLIGGIPRNFTTSARITDSPFFVIEADEYDTAFFDKRSKFLHYRPEIVIINNIEFDHADIFSSIEDIKKQFHYLLRTVPNFGKIIYPLQDPIVLETLKQGVWTKKESFALNNQEADFSASLTDQGGQSFCFKHKEKTIECRWSLLGKHNVLNALAAMSAAFSIGVDLETAAKALSSFKNVKRRLEKIAQVRGIEIYEDFAHHPTAIYLTLEGLRKYKPESRIIALVELASNTMKAGVHQDKLIPSLCFADEAHILQAEKGIPFVGSLSELKVFYHEDVNSIISAVCQSSQPNDVIIIMSNKSFAGIYSKLPQALNEAL